MTQIRFATLALGAICFAFSGSSAHAGWGSYGSYGSNGSYGSYGGYGSSYGSTGYGSYGSYSSYSSYGSVGSYSSYGSYGSHGNRVGLLKRLANRLHHRLHRNDSCGSSGYSSYYGSTGYSSYGSTGYGSYGSGYSSYGSTGYGSTGYGSYGSSYSSYGSTGYGSTGYGSTGYGSAGSVSYPSYSAPVQADCPDCVGSTSTVPAASYAAASSAGEARLTLRVPNEARVYVNGRETTSDGEVREYVSRGLEAGSSYTYDIRVEAEVDGETVVKQSSVDLTSGRSVQLAFQEMRAASVAAAPAETSLTLRVPADAEVNLAGTPTEADGETRTYRTTQLQEGQKWDNYVITATVVRDGRPVTQEKVITLTGGENAEIAFDFDATTLASR